MPRSASVACALALITLAARPALAQDTTTQRGVRIGLTYQPGTKPGIVVLPVTGPDGDSVRAILQRDLDYGDRIDVITGDAVASTASAQVGGAGGVGGGGTTINYGVWKSIGAAALVQAAVGPLGVHVVIHDVTAKRAVRTGDFPLAGSPGSAQWRLAVHGVSDEIERWITGVRGIAQTRILYVRANRVYVIDSDGYGEHAVSDAGTVLAPAWSPNGRYIAYSRLGRRGWDIVVHDLVTGSSRTLAATPGGLNTTPAFSPDGKSIAYAHAGENGTDIYITSPFGSGGAQRVTVGRGTDNISPSFSPDGGRVAFTSGRSGHPEVYTADVDGSNVELLTPFNFGDQYYRSNPDWSPDGRLIAFQSLLNGQFQVMTISLRDRTVKQLTSEGVNEDPSWAPDARHLVFTSSRTGVKQLFVLDTESGRARQLTHVAGARLGAWSHWLDHVQ